MATVGLILGSVGSDPISGARRFTFGRLELIDGISFVAVVIGLFAIGEILYSLRHPTPTELLKTKIHNLRPNRADLTQARGPILRGSLIGFLLGVLPGARAVISTFVSYTVEKRLSKEPERFGHGAIEAWPGPSRPTTPRPVGRWSRSSRWVSPARRSPR